MAVHTPWCACSAPIPTLIPADPRGRTGDSVKRSMTRTPGAETLLCAALGIKIRVCLVWWDGPTSSVESTSVRGAASQCIASPIAWRCGRRRQAPPWTPPHTADSSPLDAHAADPAGVRTISMETLRSSRSAMWKMWQATSSTASTLRTAGTVAEVSKHAVVRGSQRRDSARATPGPATRLPATSPEYGCGTAAVNFHEVSLWIGACELAHQPGDHLGTSGSGVLVAHRRRWCGVAQSFHQLGDRGARGSRQHGA